MKNKKTMKHGTVQQSYELRLQYSKTERKDSIKTESKIEKIVSLDIGPYYYSDAFTMRQVLDFQKGANELVKEIHELLMQGTYIEVSLIISAHEHVPEYEEITPFGPHKATLKQIAFDCWEYKGDGWSGDGALDLEGEEGGLYFRPDIRYTDECKDLYILWNQDILEALAETGL